MGRMGRGKSYSANSNDYKLLEEVGYGASATVYRAIYLPFNELVAVKCLDLDRCNSNLDDIRREAQIMSLIDHPNVIKAHCSFVVDHSLWVVMPFMAEGSCLHLMKMAYPDGFEESAICSILKETLKALEYLHRHGHIHRDVKAGNILLDSNGDVKLGDFGVSACMFDKGDRQRSRNTFVGTPCWMAPEVLQPGTGYDFKADIWSFGITALELAHGHAPFSKYPPMKVLLMTIQNAPPGLDYDRDKKFSKQSFKEMVAMCLVKDQTKRPSAEKLLKHSFFKNAKPPEVSVKKLFSNLPPLWDRVKALQLKDAAQLALKKMPSAEQEALSQSEYQRGVSAWNFDIEDLKIQASLLQDDDGIQEFKEEDECMKFGVNNKDVPNMKCGVGKSNSKSDIVFSELINVGEAQSLCFNDKRKTPEIELLDSKISPEKDIVQQKSRTTGKNRQSQSGPLMPGVVLTHSTSEMTRAFERFENNSQSLVDKNQHDIRRAPSFSGPLMLPNRASANSLSAPIKSSGGFRDSLEDKTKSNLVQIKGRFSVTSENVDLVKDIPLCTVPRCSQGSPLRKSASLASVGDWIFDARQMPTKEVCNTNMVTSLLMPHLQNLLQQTSIQQELIVNMLNNLQPGEIVEASPNGKLPPLPRSSDSNGNVESVVSDREGVLLLKISELQARMRELTEELSVEKQKYLHMHQQLSALTIQEEETDSTRETEAVDA
ncbi:serine/threonine-protein kinase BLUS1-like isoform X3 [Impatiens glandulifera]|uniref:serine/threonine-protein kinase BLUS1-like isoform X3 n=1 Tax=Impatiens glandulifera TaxID=253017 RepID=UPI001FB169D2|nr:serine/threonine-protein kinase BLUS1-like isoform X3 [Impatiens glandulifera]